MFDREEDDLSLAFYIVACLIGLEFVLSDEKEDLSLESHAILILRAPVERYYASRSVRHAQ